ncbi:MAG: YbhB/YbcL family Raf kinase inhibitor-like protein [Gammaproteobacteria bacterium]|nr:YbhB/YbcL family Raf kinase inhibitor-like protein [Gammaproteobacteria bacterium]MDH5799453.1 YbhB/YbcL family Raf kinase inhibitor-like protein [Gammaproteobacteria bacterium]
MVFCIQSSAFNNNDVIPVRYTCRGEDVSPPLQWQDPPSGTKSLTLVVEDTDADPQTPEAPWIHWVLYNLPPQCQSLPEGVQTRSLPPGTQLALNDWKTSDYNGPCLVNGKHRYRHTLYALNTVLPDLGKIPGKKLLQIVRQHVLAQSTLTGEFESNT